MMNAEDWAVALRCCLEDDCENCPLLREICDPLQREISDMPDIEMVSIPVWLLESIAEVLDEQL